MRSRFGIALLGAVFALPNLEVLADTQYCKYESIQPTTPTSRFIDNLDGTVTDNVMGLQWKRCAEGRIWDGVNCRGSDAVFGWQEALQHADHAAFIGKYDWRLPNVKELSSIVERACYSPAINLEVFPEVYATAAYWTATPAPYTSAIVVDFEYGELRESRSRVANSSSYASRVLLVRDADDSIVPEGRLNDTGIDWWVNADTNYLSDPQADFPGQDADWGRDVGANGDADGHAGFSFTKLDAVGDPLPKSANAWSCIRDNVTGLIWENKNTISDDLHNRDWYLLWYNADPTTNGGNAGRPDPNVYKRCHKKGRCDTAKYIEDVNSTFLCGANNWRLPTVDDLRSLVDFSKDDWVIDENYFEVFRSTVGSTLWTATPSQDYSQSDQAYVFSTRSGATRLSDKDYAPGRHVWLVRDNVPSYVVTAVVDSGGTVVPEQRVVASNTAAQFTVIASSGFTRDSSVGGTCPQGSWNGDTWTTGAINGNCSVSFSFTADSITYTITPSAGAGGSVSPFGPQTITAGHTQSFTVTSNSGYARDSAVGGTCPKGDWSGDIWTTGAINANCTVRFSFHSAIRFADIAPTFWAWQYIYAIADAGITAGCGGGNYCPAKLVTRAEMAAFLLRGINGCACAPPAPKGTKFSDVPKNYWAASWIEQLAKEGVTQGCGGGRYCPENTVTRAEMAVFLLRSKNGSSYAPPAAKGTKFNDVPKSHWAASWIEKLAADGVTTGCGGGNYCPDNSVTRAEMAVFLARTFNLPLPAKP